MWFRSHSDLSLREVLGHEGSVEPAVGSGCHPGKMGWQDRAQTGVAVVVVLEAWQSFS